jgi:hypothetical protein
MKITSNRKIYLTSKGREAPHILETLSSVFDKKVGILIKKNLQDIEIQGMKILREYL